MRDADWVFPIVLSITVRVLIATCAFLYGANSWAQIANICPPGSRQVWQGMGYMCQCPDGSYANYGVPCAQAAPRCPYGTQECGNYCCNPGFYCSRYGCTPEGATDCGNNYCRPGYACSRGGGCIPAGTDDCGGGNYCSEGKVCWKSEWNWEGYKRNQLYCVRPEVRDRIDGVIREARQAMKERVAQLTKDVSSANVNVKIVTDSNAVHKDNCVFFIRNDRGVPLPSGLEFFEGKKKIINVTDGPRAGDVAIIRINSGEFAKNGHVALVKSVDGGTITIEEAHFKGVSITERTVEARTLQAAEQKLSIVGYYRPE